MSYIKYLKRLKKEGFDAFLCDKSLVEKSSGKSLTKPYHIATSADGQEIQDTIGKAISIKQINGIDVKFSVSETAIIKPFLKVSLSKGFSFREYSDKESDFQKARNLTIEQGRYDPIEDELSLYDENSYKTKTLKFVGNPFNKISQDRLTMLHIIKMLSILGESWSIDFDSFESIKRRSMEISVVSLQNIRRMLREIMQKSEKPSLAFRMMFNTNLLNEILPKLMKSRGLIQEKKKEHLDLFDHILLTLDDIDKDENHSEELRWAAIFHDIAKPYVKYQDEKGSLHFFGHDKIGAIFASRWLYRMGFPKVFINKVDKICRYHLFDYHMDESKIPSFINKVGRDNILDLIRFRKADKRGSGRHGLDMSNEDKFKNKVLKKL